MAQALPLIERSGCMACDASFVNMFIWKNLYQSLICIRNGFLFRRGVGRSRLIYSYPLGGGDIADALSLIREDAAEAGGLPAFEGLTEEQCPVVAAVYKDINYTFEKTPQWADYIYHSSDLAALGGKKYHSKRNFINRFQAEYGGRYALKEITPDMLDELWRFNLEWCAREGCAHGHNGVGSESCAIRTAFSNYTALGLRGQALYVDGAIAAYTFASHLLDTVADVHVEKALASVTGAYAVINQALAAALAPSYQYLNREEDMGLDGLRQAKASYHPAIHLMRYSARGLRL